MQKISKHCSYKEATTSNTAIKRGIDNTPNSKQLAAMKLTAEMVFEPLRKWYGKTIWVTSFFRCVLLNTIIGGSKTSAHCNGEAMDIDTQEDNAKLFEYIQNNLDFDKLIWEFGDDENPDWVHFSYKSSGNRGIVLRAYKEGKKTVYRNFKY